MLSAGLPRLIDIEAAAHRISGVASKTPLIESPALSRRFGRSVYLKLECFQPIRVFKIRGAYNKISQISAKNIVAASSGNHGIAVAYSSRMLGKQCTVVVPEAAVKEKVDVIQEYGAEVVRFGKYHSDREEKARAGLGSDLRTTLQRSRHYRGPGDVRAGDRATARRLRLSDRSRWWRRAHVRNIDRHKISQALRKGLRSGTKWRYQD